jgi:hypothetical protein
MAAFSIGYHDWNCVEAISKPKISGGFVMQAQYVVYTITYKARHL